MTRPTVRLVLEQLEDRLAPATFTVTTTNDNGGVPLLGKQPNTGSLRAAINAVNTGQVDTIVFNIAAGNQKILVDKNPLPTVMKPVTIDGSTVPGQSIEITPESESEAGKRAADRIQWTDLRSWFLRQPDSRTEHRRFSRKRNPPSSAHRRGWYPAERRGIHLDWREDQSANRSGHLCRCGQLQQ